MKGDGGTRSSVLATSVVMICARSAARNRISLMTRGHASASTQICTHPPPCRGWYLPGSEGRAEEDPMASAKLPTPNELKAVGRQLGMSLSDADVAFFLETMGGTVAAYHAIEAMADPMPAVKYPRTPGYRPEGAENKYNAWYYKSEVQGAPTGKLAGKTIVLKDNVCLAGVPMMNGASTLEGYVPDVDATIVTRMLDAGGTIVGKAHCEYFCFSGGSHTCAAGPVHNPRKPGYSAGGSSSGSAALVAAGEVDMAIGGDQGGSIRIPASYCGIYGMKPTHGLVPYTGIMPIEIYVDHTGPMTATVRDNALLLEVIAGPDGYDPRQYSPTVHRYTESLGAGIDGLRIALVKEGFGLRKPKSLLHEGDPQTVDAGAERFGVPMHLGRVLAGVVAVGTGDDFQQERVVADRRRHGFGVIDVNFDLHDGRVGDEAVGGLHPVDAAEGRRHADRAALAAADRHVGLAEGNEDRAPRRGAAGRVTHLVRIVDGTGGVRVAAARQAEVLAVRLAQDGAAGV